MHCAICYNKRLQPFLDLGHQPPSDAFLRAEDLGKPELTYPLQLYFCPRCKLVQLGYMVDPALLFGQYVYTSGMNNSLIKNFRELVEKIVSHFHLTSADLAIDIGSNDGTLLEQYRPYAVRVLGIDPSSATKIALKKGVPMVVDFFTESVAERVQKKYGRAQVITATNVFAHVSDPTSFLEGVKKLLKPDGVFISESGYLLDLVEKLQYDSVYHEHLRYYALQSIVTLLRRLDLEVFDVERIPTHNGSIRVYAGRRGVYSPQSSVAKLLQLEQRYRLYNIKTLQQFARRVQQHRLALLNLLLTLKRRGKKIVGIGAPAKGNTLLNTCRIGPEIIDYLVEKSTLKIDMFSPGMHIPVISERQLFKDQPDYGLILSWNIAEELQKKLRAQGYRGKFIVPFPKPAIC